MFVKAQNVKHLVYLSLPHSHLLTYSFILYQMLSNFIIGKKEKEKYNSLTTLTGKCKCLLKKKKSTKTVSVTWNERHGLEPDILKNFTCIESTKEKEKNSIQPITKQCQWNRWGHMSVDYTVTLCNVFKPHFTSRMNLPAAADLCDMLTVC